MESGDPNARTTRNVVGGTASADTIVQAGRIDAVHFHQAPASAPVQQSPGAVPRGSIVVGEIPREPASFQPREDLRQQLTEALTGTSTHVAVVCAVTGTRGVGKTHLAAAYARQRIADGWPVVAWITAEDSGQLLTGLDQLADALGLRIAGEDSGSAGWKVRHWLETAAPDRSVIVFDNATDADELARWLPAAGRAQIIITSTQRSFADLGACVDVSTFTVDEALTFLRQRTGSVDEAGAWALAEEVGWLPLALAQAAALICSQRISYSALIGRLRALPVEHYLKPRPGDGYPRGAAQAVLLSLHAAEEAEPLARPLVDLLAVLSPGGVRRTLLRNGPERVSTADIDTALGALADASLIDFSTDGQSVIMHRFTQRVVRDRLDHDMMLPQTLSHAATLLKEVEVSIDRAWRERGTADHLILQVDAIWEVATTHLPAQPDQEWADLINALVGLRYWTARHLRETGEVTRATPTGWATLVLAEEVLPLDHSLTPVIRNELAQACRAAGRLDDAIALLEKNTSVRERLLGQDHPQTLNSRHNLANTWRANGRIDDAIALHERNLADRERVLGPDHPDTLMSRNDLAWALREAGHLDRAIDLFTRTLLTRERTLPADHPKIFLSRNNLANSYLDAGRVPEAVRLLADTLKHREQLLGIDHPKTLLSRTSLARAYLKADRLPEAIALFENVAAYRERLHGHDHPESISSRSVLGNAYHAAGRLEEATDLLERTLADRERILGRHQPKTIDSRIDLAVSYAALDREPEALELLESAITDCGLFLNDSHPITRRARAVLSELRNG